MSRVTEVLAVARLATIGLLLVGCDAFWETPPLPKPEPKPAAMPWPAPGPGVAPVLEDRGAVLITIAGNAAAAPRILSAMMRKIDPARADEIVEALSRELATRSPKDPPSEAIVILLNGSNQIWQETVKYVRSRPVQASLRAEDMRRAVAENPEEVTRLPVLLPPKGYSIRVIYSAREIKAGQVHVAAITSDGEWLAEARFLGVAYSVPEVGKDVPAVGTEAERRRAPDGAERDVPIDMRK